MDTGLIILILIFISVFLGFCIGSYVQLCREDHSSPGKIFRTEVVTDGGPKISGKMTFENRAGFSGNYYMKKFCIENYFNLCGHDHSKIGKIPSPTKVVTEGSPKISGKLTYVNRAGFTGNYWMEKCECKNQFKGRCVLCHGPTFVDDDILGIAKISFGDRGNAPIFDCPEVKEGDQRNLFYGKGNNTVV